MSRQRAVALLVPGLLVLVAAVTRFALLAHPDRIIFDETYYVEDARGYLVHGVEEGFAVHPPVGKWMIAAGIRLAGDTPFGWRSAAAAAGVLVVLFTYLAGARLLRWRGAAALAAFLATVDGLLFVQSRIAMLDIFLALFVVLGSWLLLVDADRSGLFTGLDDVAPRRRRRRRGAEQLELPVPAGGSVDDPPAEPWPDDGAVATAVADVPPDEPEEPVLPRRGHAVRVLAGVAFGLALATKWSAVLAIGAAVLVTLAWELAWRRRMTGRWTVGAGRLVRSVLLSFALVPLAVYLVSYVPWLVNYAHTSEGEKVCEVGGEALDPCYVSIPGRFAGLWRYQKAILNFHDDLEAEHPYRAPAYTWPVMGRPVVYYWESCDENRAKGVATTNDEGELVEPEPCVVAQGNAAEIIDLGNPAVWWVALAAVVPLGIGAAMRDRRAWFVLAFWLVQMGPWLLLSLPGVPFGRPLFFFYMTPIVAFMALAVAYTAVWLDDTVERVAGRLGVPLVQRRLTAGAVLAIVVAATALGLYLHFYPVYVGLELDYDAVRQRWWFPSWI